MIRFHTIHTVTFGALAALAAGCVDNNADAPMRIIANIAPGEGCTVDSASNVFLDDGILDAQAGVGYIFTPAVVNELTLIEGEGAGPKTIYIEGAHVDIAFFDTTTFDAASFPAELLSFDVPTSGSIEPGGGTAAFSFEIVPIELARMMADAVDGTASGRTTLDVRIQMFGIKGGGEVESRTFRYPVQICNGCLLANLGDCTLLPSGSMGSPGGVCNALQDGVLECCTLNGEAVCPAVPATPPPT